MVAAAASAAPAAETPVKLPTPHEQFTAACEEARSMLDGGHALGAAEAARRALEALPRGLEAQRLLGLALLEAGNPRQAMNAFQKALGADPFDPVALVGYAEAQDLLEGAANAEAGWLRAWEADPSLPEVGDRLQQARRAAGVLDARAGRPPITRPALARIHLRSGLNEHAAAEARTILARDVNRLDALLTLAEALWRGGETELAGAVAAEILETAPDVVVANLLLAAQYAAEGRDLGPLIERIQAVDPAGAVAARLFDDREVPALFGADQALDVVPPAHDAPEAGDAGDVVAGEPAARPGEPEREAVGQEEALAAAEPVEAAAEPAVAAGAASAGTAPGELVSTTGPVPSLAETQPLLAVGEHEQAAAGAMPVSSSLEAGEEQELELVAPAGGAGATAGGEPAGDEAPEVVGPILAGETPAVPALETPADAAVAGAAGTAGAAGEAAMAEAALEPAAQGPAPTAEAVEPAAGRPLIGEPVAPAPELPAAWPAPAGLASRAAGDAALRAGRHFEAMRAYGAWLREIRAALAAPEQPRTS
jgi:tetratricopeptide (TPR) repeat protein